MCENLQGSPSGAPREPRLTRSTTRRTTISTHHEAVGASGVPIADQLTGHAVIATRAFELPNAVIRQFDFWDDSYEWRRLFSELLGTFLLVTVAVGGGMVNARFGGTAISAPARAVAPALMVMAVILFMGAVSGAHLNPVVSFAFALRGNFPWRRVPSYIAAQLAGAVLATLALLGLVGSHGSAGLTLPGPGVSTLTALLWEILLTAGLVSVVLGTASGAQQLGPIAAFGVGTYIALAGLVGGPMSGASMNPARSLGPAAVLGIWTSWWAYLVGPVIGALIAVGMAHILRGPGGGLRGSEAAQGTLGTLWRPGRIGSPLPAPDRPAGGQPGPDRPAGGQPGPDRPASGQPGPERPAGGQPGPDNPGGGSPGSN
jgi:aquaporin Z